MYPPHKGKEKQLIFKMGINFSNMLFCHCKKRWQEPRWYFSKSFWNYFHFLPKIRINPWNQLGFFVSINRCLVHHISNQVLKIYDKCRWWVIQPVFWWSITLRLLHTYPHFQVTLKGSRRQRNEVSGNQWRSFLAKGKQKNCLHDQSYSTNGIYFFS